MFLNLRQDFQGTLKNDLNDLNFKWLKIHLNFEQLRDLQGCAPTRPQNPADDSISIPYFDPCIR